MPTVQLAAQPGAGAAACSDTPMLLGVSHDVAGLMGAMAQAAELRVQAASFAASADQLGRMQLSLAPDARELVLRQQVQLR